MENSTQAAPQPAAETEHLNKIRSILFGEHLHHQNQRFEQIETHISDRYNALNAQLSQQIDSLESRLVQRFEALAERIEGQLAQQSNHQQSATESLEQALRNDMQHQVRSLKAQLEEHIEQSTQDMKAQLNQQKSTSQASQLELSNLFGEIAKKLGQP